MRNLLLIVLLLALMSSFTNSQAQVINIPITVTDGAGGTQELRFGLDPAATDGRDAGLGEVESPPPPPVGVFDARFIGTDIGIDLGQGQTSDFRAKPAPTGTTLVETVVHEFSYQVGTGTQITISWDLPSGVTGLLEDLINGTLVNESMDGTDSHTETNPGGISKLKMTITYTFDGNGDLVTSVEDGQDFNIPEKFALRPNYPNPFNPSTTINYELAENENINLEIYDILGNHVRTLVKRHQQAGSYSIKWDGRDELSQIVASGVYVYRIRAGNFTQSRKMLFLQ